MWAHLELLWGQGVGLWFPPESTCDPTVTLWPPWNHWNSRTT